MGSGAKDIFEQCRTWFILSNVLISDAFVLPDTVLRNRPLLVRKQDSPSNESIIRISSDQKPIRELQHPTKDEE